jgi:hypothetical protein
MKIHVLSDLHLEFGPITLPRVDAGLVVLAGDVHTKRNGIPWIRQTFACRIRSAAPTPLTWTA